MIEVVPFTVGPVQENSYLARAQGGDRAVLFDPGEEADRLLAGIDELGVRLDAILLTHTHFDHVGAVAPVARATGAPVYCPALERDVMLDIDRYVPWPGIGPFENHEPEELVGGGERVSLAGLDFDVVFTPGHSPGHVTWALADGSALFSGDVLFQGSIGRTDLPFGDHQTLLRSIAGLLDAYPDEARVFPGHMGVTTLGAERASNPFLQDLVA
ncbi:MBL fold metallo-hydrolase [Conexibacter woesei]|uniref:Beta-lactamase domain protein n=1 Tax=Conexibacter woesei (strain DSM 14684 / CCUG 47730 / CIP 108061 / JCM 11494 / NBRC 100937 / ID131577) TaxID=469383 RepID=D3FCS1_CONWI|nr:MBL fold metallo-hydrolase [Conexibacter woesei]ADB51433.1 beta-lactamase domain protein [Conexibacter woesei DSM 14684]